MKKFFLLSCALLFSISVSLAQTTNTSITPSSSAVSTADPLIIIARHIDRRLAQFNRAVKTHDMEGLQALISSENKDFSANFLKFIETAPAGSVKRDAERGIIKTPQDEYTFPAMLSLGGKEAKITMTFVEEDSETGDKWIIVDSNLHIIGKVLVPAQAQPTTIPPKGPLTSNALNTPPSTKPATQTPTVVPKNNIPPENTKTPSQPPLASKAIQKPVPAKVPPMISQPSDSTGLGVGILVTIAISITLLLGGVVGIYYFMRKRNNLGKALLASQAVASVSVLSESTPPPTSPQPEPMISLENTPSLEPLAEKAPLEQTESNVSLIDTPPAPLITLSELPVPISPETSAQITDTPPQKETQTLSPSPENTELPQIETNVPSLFPEEILSEGLPSKQPETLSVPPEVTQVPLLSAPSFDSLLIEALPLSAEPSVVPESLGAVDPIFSSAPENTPVTPDPLLENILTPKPPLSTDSTTLFGTL